MYRYSFADTDPSTLGAFFTFDSPVLITAPTTFLPTSCRAFQMQCVAVSIDPDFLPESSESCAINMTLMSPNGGYADLEESCPGAFLTVGSHTFNTSSLKVGTVPDVEDAPEPPGLLLLGTGMLGAVAVWRGRRWRVGSVA